MQAIMAQLPSNRYEDHGSLTTPPHAANNHDPQFHSAPDAIDYHTSSAASHGRLGHFSGHNMTSWSEYPTRLSPPLIRGRSLDDPFVESATPPRALPTNPARLVELIKSGALDDECPPPPMEYEARDQYGRSSPVPIPVAQPLVQLWSAQMVPPVADPPFFSEGRRPSLKEALDWEPFPLPANAIPVIERGVVVVKNVSCPIFISGKA